MRIYYQQTTVKNKIENKGKWETKKKFVLTELGQITRVNVLRVICRCAILTRFSSSPGGNRDQQPAKHPIGKQRRNRMKFMEL